MQIIPAIDLMKGKVVRLKRGDPNTAKTYDYIGSPKDIALKWKSLGATRLHIIDLDATFETGNNYDVISEITKVTKLPIQVGGGIRSLEAIETLFNTGIKYVILGALAFKTPEIFSLPQNKFDKNKVIVALDNKKGEVMVEGWRTRTNLNMLEALEKFYKLGIQTFLITSIVKDGMLEGPDLESLSEAVIKYPNVEVMAAGGIGKIEDLLNLKRIGVKSVVIGKALYENKFSLEEAIKTIGGK